MEKIFHEKQEGSLCAQHCLNNLLQGSFFTPVDLADLAGQLDETERETMAEGGATEEYRQFLAQPSSNFDDSGYFSIQVLQTALRVWGLDLLNFTSSDERAVDARTDPTTQVAYVCNFKDHWFSIRKIGYQWFNLNSLLTSPELISDTYLALFLTQLQQEGYSIFIVLGELVETEADQLLKLIPAVQVDKPGLSSESPKAPHDSETYSDTDLVQALAMSKQMADEEDESLQHALALSAAELASSSTQSANHTQLSSSEAAKITLSEEELRRKRLEYFTQGQAATSASNEPEQGSQSAMTDEDMLEAAIAMSLKPS